MIPCRTGVICFFAAFLYPEEKLAESGTGTGVINVIMKINC
jgi:hypothetical protein